MVPLAGRLLAAACVVTVLLGPSFITAHDAPAFLYHAQAVDSPDPTAGDEFGRFLATTTDRFVAMGYGIETGQSGLRAHIFDRDVGDRFELAASVPIPTPAANFGAKSLAVDGDTAVVGLPRDSTECDRCGSAFILERGPTGWTVAAELQGEATPDVRFGMDVDVAGGRVAVGAYDSVWIYERAGSAWTLTTVLRPGPADVIGYFGFRVALDENRLALTQTAYPQGLNGGAVRTVALWERTDAGDWRLGATLLPPGSAYGNFGHAVALAGDVLAVGDPERTSSTGVARAGAVFVYRAAVDGSWPLEAQLEASSPRSIGWFGSAVDLATDGLVVRSSNAGEVTLFSHGNGAWTQDGRVHDHPSSGPGFGFATGFVGGGAIAITALRDSSIERWAGRVDVFAFDTVPPDVWFRAPAAGAVHTPVAAAPGVGVATVVGPTTVDVGATDAQSGVAFVDVLVDGVARARLTAAPYEWRWATSDETLGEHVLSAIATDNVGHTNRTDLTVFVVPSVWVDGLEVPGAPGVPAAPDAPAVPDLPTVPSVPDAPGTPDAPRIPDEPDTPPPPGAPGAPEMVLGPACGTHVASVALGTASAGVQLLTKGADAADGEVCVHAFDASAGVTTHGSASACALDLDVAPRHGTTLRGGHRC